MAVTFIDISVHPEIGPVLMSVVPAIVWDREMESVLWANASGVRLMGYDYLGELLDADFNDMQEDDLPYIMSEQMRRGVRELITKAGMNGDRELRFGVNRATDTSRMTLVGRAEKIDLADLPGRYLEEEERPSEPAILMQFQSGRSLGLVKPGEDEPEPVKDLLSIFGDQPGCAAVLNENGQLIADAGAMALSRFEKTDVKSLHRDVQSETDRLVKRLVRSDEGAHPAGIALLDNGQTLLLIAGETLEDIPAGLLPEIDADEESAGAEVNPLREPSAFAKRVERAEADTTASPSERRGPRTVQLADMERIRRALTGEDPIEPASDLPVGQDDDTDAAAEEVMHSASVASSEVPMEKASDTVVEESDPEDSAIAEPTDQQPEPDETQSQKAATEDKNSFFGGMDYWYFSQGARTRPVPVSPASQSQIADVAPDVSEDAASDAADEHFVDFPDDLSDLSQVAFAADRRTIRSIETVEALEAQLYEDSSDSSEEQEVSAEAQESATQTAEVETSDEDPDETRSEQAAAVADSLDLEDHASQEAEAADEQDHSVQAPIESVQEDEGSSDADELDAAENDDLVDDEQVDSAPVGTADVSPQSRPTQPIRFAFSVDADSRVTNISPEFASAVGRSAANISGKPWSAISETLNIDAAGEVAKALSGRDTWSGRQLMWPVEGTSDQIPVELSALPNFSRTEGFTGFRGFGVARVGDQQSDPHGRGLKISDADFWPEVAPDDSENIGSFDSADQAAIHEQPSVLTANTTQLPGRETLLGEVATVLPFAPGKTAQTESTEIESAVGDDDAESIEPSDERDEAIAHISDALGISPSTFDESQEDDDLREAMLAVEAEAGTEIQEHTALVEPAIDIRDLENEPEEFRKLLDALESRDDAILCYRNDQVLFANSAMLELTGYRSAADIQRAGGLNALLADNLYADDGPMALTTARGEQQAVAASLKSIAWKAADTKALMITLQPVSEDVALEEADAGEKIADPAPSLGAIDDLAGTLKLGLSIPQLHEVLETATDGVVVLNKDGHIHALNRSAEALFGFETSGLAGRSFASLFASDSQQQAQEYLDAMMGSGLESVLNDGRELTGFEVSGGLIPLFVTLGRLAGEGQANAAGFCAVLRDITQWKKVERELVEARQEAELANKQKSEFLAKISHEIRTPLNAIIGFSEVMADERFGPLGNARYREYLRDINKSGGHVLDLVNDLLDISKIESGGLELDREEVDLNNLIASSVSLMQPEANRQRVIIRTSLSNSVPKVIADAKSLRQIALNLLSNAIKFTNSGGQVILSTAQMRNGEVELRIRDTGIGMTQDEVDLALKPYRQLSTGNVSGESKGTGLGLPLTKAMVEANGAEFVIHSERGEGTWIVVGFPKERVLPAK